MVCDVSSYVIIRKWLYFILKILAGRKARGSVVVKALCYKLEGRGFDTR
jgi:hypothetical protein